MLVLEEVDLTNGVTINYFAVFLAAAVYFLLGLLWYSPTLFGNSFKHGIEWMEGHKPSYWSYIGEIIISFLIAQGLAIFIAISDVGIYGGIVVALMIWITFVATTHFSAVLWSRKSFKHFCIHSGFMLIGFILMGAILGWL